MFAATLQGHPLISNRSIWRNFPWVWNERWSFRNIVLIGDALRTAHYSIGSGTRLAMEDALALTKALEAVPGDLAAALARYEAMRRPIVEKLVAASKQSAAWYERFPEHMRLSPGGAGDELHPPLRPRRRRAPARHGAQVHGALRCAAGLAAGDAMTADTAITDLVPLDAPGTREIGFALPERYNASAILLDNLAAGRGSRTAVTGPAGTRTYAELAEDASRFAAGLLSLGAKRGERVLLFLDDTPAYPAALFGAIGAGLVPVLVNTLTPSDLLQFYLADSGARIAVTEAAFADRFNDVACQGTELATLLVVNGKAPAAAAIAMRTAADWLSRPAPALAVADTHRDDMAFWMYSSGSTGRPKGIVHLQHDMAYTHLSYARHLLALSENDICFSVPKIFFAYGLGNSITFPFAAGASSVLLPGQPKPAAIFDCIARYRPTVFFGLPTLYTALTKAPEAKTADLSSLRLAVSAAEVLSAEVFNAWKAISRPRHHGGPGLHRGAAHLSLQHALAEEAGLRRQAGAGLRGEAHRCRGPRGR